MKNKVFQPCVFGSVPVSEKAQDEEGMGINMKVRDEMTRYLEILSEDAKMAEEIIRFQSEEIDPEELIAEIRSLMEKELYMPIIHKLLSSSENLVIGRALNRFYFLACVNYVKVHGQIKSCEDIIRLISEEHEIDRNGKKNLLG